MSELELEVLAQMDKRGGSFVKALANAFRHADPENFVILQSAFRGYWNHYLSCARVEMERRKAGQ